MKLAFVEMAGFRCFKDKTRFDLPRGFAVLTGRNGAGKSTVLDAVDFVLTGTINKFAVKGAKGGGLNDHIWWVGEGVPEAEYVSVGLVDDDDQELVVTRRRDQNLSVSLSEIARHLCVENAATPNWPETLIRTTLIRDETIAALSLDLPEQARFSAIREAIGGLSGPDYSARIGAVLQAATVARTEQKVRVTEAQSELGRALGALTEARSVAERESDVSQAAQIIAELEPELVDATGERAEMLRRRIVERKMSITALEAAVGVADDLQTERLYLESDTGQVDLTTARSDQDSAKILKDRADEDLSAVLRAEAIERESDAYASHMIALLQHGEAVGLDAEHCPLCGASRSSAEFTAAIAAARSRLSARGDRAARTAEAVTQARNALEQSQAALTSSSQRLAALEIRRSNLARDSERVASTFRLWRLEATPSDPNEARRLVLQRQEQTARLEQALYILEASGAHDRVATLESRVDHLRLQLDNETEKLTTAEKALEAAKQIDSSAKSVANQVLTEQFDTVLPLLRELYQRLRPHIDWRDIEADFGGRVRASLNLSVGDGRNPQFLFSSGQRRAAGIAFLLAIHLSRPWCLLRSLLLDDPIQHIDDYRALNLVEVLSAVRRTGRQVVIAVEDAALADVLCRRLRSTAVETGRRFDLTTSKNGSAAIERQADIFPLPREVLQTAEAS